MTDAQARPILDHARVSDGARKRLAAFHPEVIEAVTKSIDSAPVVVIGMALNPHVKKVRKALDAAKIEHTYLEYGGYTSQWRERLAIKLWSGWPTFPQVFVKGELLGGEELTRAAIADGTLVTRLAK